MAVIGSLSVKLGLVTVEWDKATAQAKQQAKELQASFNELGEGVKKVSEVWEKFGDVIGLVGLTTLIDQTIELSETLEHLSKSYDLSISQTLTFRQALLEAGVNADGASKILSTLFSKIESAKEGNDAAIASFERIGISFSELQNLTPYEAIKRVASGLSNIGDTYERIKAVKDLLGKAGIGATLEDIKRALDEGTQKNDKYAESLEKLTKLGDTLKENLENLKVAFANVIAPFSDVGVTQIETFKAIIEGLVAATAISSILKFSAAFIEVATAIKEAETAAAIFNLTAGGTTPIGLIIKGLALAGGIAAFTSSISESKPKQETNVKTTSQLADDDEAREKSSNKITDNVSKEAQAKQTALQLTNQLLALDEKRENLQLQQISDGGWYLKNQIQDVALQEKIVTINAKRNEELEKNKLGTDALKTAINASADAEIRRATEQSNNIKRNNQALGDYKLMLQQINSDKTFEQIEAEQYKANLELGKSLKQNEIVRAGAAITEIENQERLAKLANERLQYENSLVMLLPQEKNYLLEQYDLQQKLKEFQVQGKKSGLSDTQIEKHIEQQRELGQTQIDLKESAVDTQNSFSVGWNTAFQNYARSATNAANIAENSMRSVTSNMDNALSNFVKTGKLNFADLTRSIIQDLIIIQLKAQAAKGLGGLFSALGFGGGNVNVGTVTGADMDMFYADGGDPPVNQPAIVGEQGPELFIPKTAGTIIPNNKMMGLGGQTTNNVTNNYIQAIDTKSFEDRLYGSSAAIWAANQYATKNIATTRSRT
jgi:hypothetical protein